jgi:hypothetical protein
MVDVSLEKEEMDPMDAIRNTRSSCGSRSLVRFSFFWPRAMVVLIPWSSKSNSVLAFSSIVPWDGLPSTTPSSVWTFGNGLGTRNGEYPVVFWLVGTIRPRRMPKKLLTVKTCITGYLLSFCFTVADIPRDFFSRNPPLFRVRNIQSILIP